MYGAYYDAVKEYDIFDKIIPLGPLTSISQPWNSIDFLKVEILAGDTKKSWQKRVKIVETLLSSDILRVRCFSLILINFLFF